MAAFGVAWTHSNMVFTMTPGAGNPALDAKLGALRDWLFQAFPAGASVIVFFALSGYVLGLALIRNGNFIRFGIRRLFRIMPALWLGVLVTFAAERFIDPVLPMGGFHPWYQNVFLINPTWSDLAENLVLAKINIDQVIWSLVPEIVCSLALPIIVAIHFRVSLLGRFAILGLVIAVGHYSNRTTLQFAPMFYAGFFLPREIIAPYVTSRWAAIALAISGWVLLCLGNAYFLAYTSPMREVCMLGAVLMIGGIIAAPQSMTWLSSPPLRLIGRFSFSFYLLHLPVLYLLAAAIARIPSLTPNSLPGAMTFATVSIVLAMGIAGLSYRFVELPCIGIGREVYGSLPLLIGRLRHKTG